jgi:3-oxoacyl-[acyl-carrier protein] reductase
MSDGSAQEASGYPIKDKVALVIGGSRGIGAAVAHRLAACGCRVAIGYRARTDAAETVASQIVAAGGRCVTAQGDITEVGGAQKIVNVCVNQFSQIDILIISAGVAPYRPLEAIDAAFVRAIFDANVLGTILATQAALPYLTAPGGRIINFASGLAFRPIPTSSVYAASKAAVVSLTHAFSKELGPKGITVNAVAPGVIETDMTSTILAQRGTEILAATPLGRIGQPTDIAGIVTFLASPDAGWITGRTILADGGIL